MRCDGVEETEMGQRQRGEGVKVGRELLCYVARHHGQVSMTELARFLQVRESSTPRHAVRGAKGRLNAETRYRRLLAGVMQKLG